MREAAIPFNRPFVPQNSVKYVLESLASPHMSGDGPYTQTASEKISKLSSGSPVLLTTSCTHALELACLALQLEPGDEVVIPSFNFTSAALAVLASGAIPVFCDVRRDTKNIDEAILSECLSPRTRAIVPVHYAGVGADMTTILEFAHEHGLKVIEDNAHGLGGTHNGKKLGSFGSMSTLSFHETKNLQCGEGGALEVNDLSLLERIEVMREKGTNRSKFFRGQVDKYQWTDIGSSWLPSDILAALLLGQAESFEFIQAQRHAIWQRYQFELLDWSITNEFELPFIPEGESHTAHLFYMVSPDLQSRTQFIEHMKSKRVSTPFHYQSLHSSTAGQRYGRQATGMEASNHLSNCLVRLPVWVGMDQQMVDLVIEAVLDFKH